MIKTIATALLACALVVGCDSPRANRIEDAIGVAHRAFQMENSSCDLPLKARVISAQGIGAVDVVVAVSGCDRAGFYKVFCSGTGCQLLSRE